MISFIDEHRSVLGVEPICRLLPIAPSTYYEVVAKRTDVDRQSARTRHDIPSDNHRELRAAAMKMWNGIARLQTA